MSSRSNQAQAGRGRGRGNRSRQQDQRGGRRGGRNFAVTPIVRIAINGIVDGFRALPPWAQREAAHMMVGQSPDAFNATGIGSQLNQLPPNRQANIATQQPVVYGPSPAAADAGRTADGGQDGNRRSGPKLKGWDRPGICELEFAKRLKNHPTSYSETQRNQDAGLLSAALQAVSRGVTAGASESAISSSIVSARQSTNSYRRLWPSKKTRKAYAESHSPEGLGLPCIQTVDDEFIVHTRHIPEVDSDNSGSDMIDDSEEDSSAILPLSRVRFHSPDAEECAISKELVQSFIRGDKKNYTALKQKIHLLKGHIALFWIKDLNLSGLSWADLDDDLIAVELSPAKTPRRKKRKANADD